MLSSQKLSKIKGHGEYKIWYVLTLLSNWETYKRNGPDKTGIYQKWSRYTLNLMTPCTDYKEEAYSFWAVSSTLTLRDKTWTKKGRSKSKDRRWKPNGIGQQFSLPRGKMTFTVSLSKWLCFPCFCATGWWGPSGKAEALLPQLPSWAQPQPTHPQNSGTAVTVTCPSKAQLNCRIVSKQIIGDLSL